MNVLFVSAVLPYPLYSGGQIRIFNLLKRLSKKHNIHLYSFIRNNDEKKYLKHLSFCKSINTVYRGRAWNPTYIFNSIFSTYPFLFSTYNIAEMRRKIESCVNNEQIDLIHLEPGYVWPSIPKNNIPKLVAEHNIEHNVYKGFADDFKFPILKQYFQYDAHKMQLWEKKIWNAAARIIAVSDLDAEFIRKSTSKTVSVIHNAVDLDKFAYKPKKINKINLNFLFVGNFRWIQNINAVQLLLVNIWPDIAEKYPHARLRIVGQYFPDKLKTNLNKDVEVVSDVTDIVDEYNRADILLAPIYIGGGTKYKILEAMACGLSVISSLKGIEGLPVKDKVHLCVAKENTDWLKSIDFILNNPSKNLIILNNARKLIEEKYDWNKIVDDLDKAWRSLNEK